MEEWRDIPGYEGRYQASSLGRIRSLDRVQLVAGDAHRSAFHRTVKGCVLRPGAHPSGHQVVVLERKTQSAHRMVALTFHGPCPAGQETLHGDHNPANNHPGNLRYGTRGENLKMDYAAGTRGKHRG